MSQLREECLGKNDDNDSILFQERKRVLELLKEKVHRGFKRIKHGKNDVRGKMLDKWKRFV